MEISFWSEILLLFACWHHCQTSVMVMNVVEIASTESFTFECNVSSSTSITRWTYLTGSTGTSLMSYQNRICTVSQSDSFLNDISRYTYKCNSTLFQVTLHLTGDDGDLNNQILACRDAVQSDRIGSTWKIKTVQDGQQCICYDQIQFKVPEVKEGDNVTLICSVDPKVAFTNWNIGSITATMGVQGGQCITQGDTFLDDTSKYIYICNKTVYQVTILNVQRSAHNDMYMCTPNDQTISPGSNWIIGVNAPVISATMTPLNDTVNAIEYTAVEFTCTTSTARPAASVYWYKHHNEHNNDITQITENITQTTDYHELSVITSTLHFVPTRRDSNLNIFCKASNSANTSPVKSKREILLNVLYKAEFPYIAQGKEYRVKEYSPGTLSCTVKSGNPAPTLSWSCNNLSPLNQKTDISNGNVTTTFTWTPSRNHKGICACKSVQTIFKTEIIEVSLIVLYPPSKPRFTVNGKVIGGDISFIEGTTRNVTCTAESKPSPDRYTWTGPSIVDYLNKSTLTFNTIEKKDAGEYGCIVHNTMDISDVGPDNGTNSSTVNIIVLYPPVALRMNNMSILKEENLTTRCPHTAGMPFETSIVWTRNIDEKQWNGELLNIPHVEKRDAAKYSCNVSNTMKPSGDHNSYIIGQNTQSFHLDVLYEAIVTSFTIEGIASTIVIKNESDPVHFICSADSNPTATMRLDHERKILKTQTSNNLEYKLVHGICSSAGTYICSARNKYNGDANARSEVQLFVNCYPRIANEIQQNITSKKNGTITISLNVVAYPPPKFIWYKMIKGIWTLILDDDNFALDSSAVHSNLTIRSVGTEDFTSYKVHAGNDFGEMDQIYYLSPYDKPDPPINFTHIESRTTISSIYLVWAPGFDNGPPQSFNIKYKKSSDNVWNYRNVSDNGESTMEIQLTGLTENTQYVCVIFASNVKGNSSELSLTATTLKVIEKSQTNPAPIIGGIAGGVTGCIIIVIVILVIIRRYPLCNVCSKKLSRGKSDKINNRADEHDYYNTGRSEEITNQDNDDKTYNTIESDANRNNTSTEDVAYYNVANVSEYEMIHRTNVETTPYSTLDQTKLGTRSAATNDDKKAVYENLKLQVF